jgi:hypothetical protein
MNMREREREREGKRDGRNTKAWEGDMIGSTEVINRSFHWRIPSPGSILSRPDLDFLDIRWGVVIHLRSITLLKCPLVGSEPQLLA